MQVSTIAELDTHAVIGGGKAQAFGMSDSAEFFTVLSDTLYRDKKRAVAREVICNAWDAHIMLAKLDVPVEITLNEQELIIKDFGPGIAKDKIGPVYCVYGASTKVKDANQTGGFGLGCKAPFAYSDHFTVTSCHDGYRTLWAISRGGAATDGKPDFRPMVSVPTSETGISVSIPIKDEKDMKEFSTLIKDVVASGGMLAKLNGELIERLDYTPAREQGFCIASTNRNSFRESGVYLLYGTVLYPISTTDREIMRKVEVLSGLIERNARIILIAGPNTVGVTPSREALSYSELTTKTIHDLLDKTTTRLRSVGPAIARKVMRKHMEASLTDRDRITITNPSSSNPAFKGVIHRIEEIAARAVVERLSSYLKDGERNKIAYRVMQKKWRDDRRYFRRLQATSYGNFPRERFNRSRKLLLRLAGKVGQLNKLMIFTKDYSHTRWSATPVDELRHTENPIVPRLIIAPTRKAVDELLRNEIAEIRRTDTYQAAEKAQEMVIPALILTNPREKLLEDIIELADKYKIKTELLAFPKRKKAERTGDVYAGLVDLRYNARNYNWRAGTLSVTEPKQYIRASGNIEHMELGFARYDSDKAIIKKIEALFPGTVVAWTVKQEAKLKAKKIPLLDELVAAEIKKLSDTREVQYATLMKQRHFITGGGYRSIGGLIESLSSESLAICKFFFPDRVKLSDKAERLAELVGIADKMNTSKSRQVQAELTAKAKKTFAHLIITSDAADKKFAWLKPFDSIRFDKSSEETILETLRFLSRRAARTPAINITQAQKEAA
jgi:DNA polymerase/3'-5' exonuclease PolX